jgi:hypothetical protein
MTIFVRAFPRAATWAEVDQRGRMSLAPFYRGPPAGVWKATRRPFAVPRAPPSGSAIKRATGRLKAKETDPTKRGGGAHPLDSKTGMSDLFIR